MTTIYHVSNFEKLSSIDIGDTFVLYPGPQRAEGKGVYFSEEKPRVNAADGCRYKKPTAIIELEPSSAKGWWRTKPGIAKKYNRPRTWHSANRKLYLKVIDISKTNNLPLLKCIEIPTSQMKNFKEYYYFNENEKDLFSGNCGMFAIALGKIAKKQGKKVQIISFVDNVLDENDEPGFMKPESFYKLSEKTPDFLHIVAEINDEYYDGNGKTNYDEIINFIYKTRGTKIIDAIYENELNQKTISIIENNTGWDTHWTEYYKMFENKKLKIPF